MELNKARAMAIRLMDEHRVPSKWVFKFDRSKRRHGQTRVATVRGKVVHEISLSSHLTLMTSEEGVRDTILHEIAHALVGVEHMHDRVWQRKAKAIGCEFLDIDDTQNVIELCPFKYYCEADGELVFWSHRPVSVERLTCPNHPTSPIERKHVDGPEVLVSVV